MLVLLIIFMITAPLAQHKIKIELPIAALSKPPDEAANQPITLSVKDTGELYWNDEPITEAAMQAQLRVAAQRTPQPELQIRSDRDTEYQVVASVMTDAKNAGMVKVGFITQAQGSLE
jgi:biopolymer transport protein ExbD